ncbi:MAG: Transcriptional regulator, TrmB [Parcubacteria group bacterium GW2011_GWA2_47_16]|nr:MAG: Transcriptional regulator, TrmB [Parcubacteria group bacterium GW2011_GWA2_47_16]
MLKDFTNKQLEPLLELGLTKTQGVIYLSALKHGVQSVLELSKITGINRQQIYEETEKLLNLGLLEITRKQRRKYIAANPNKLLKISKENIHKAEGVFEKVAASLPLLESLPKLNSRKTDIVYFEGAEKIREAYEKELDACKNTEVLSFVGSIEDIYEFFPETFWKKWNKTFVQQKSSSRMLVHKSEAAQEAARHDEEYKRETRYLENFPLKLNIDVFNNTVLILSFYDKKAIWIESEVAASSYRIMFETFWGLAKNFE